MIRSAVLCLLIGALEAERRRLFPVVLGSGRWRGEVQHVAEVWGARMELEHELEVPA